MSRVPCLRSLSGSPSHTFAPDTQLAKPEALKGSQSSRRRPIYTQTLSEHNTSNLYREDERGWWEVQCRTMCMH